MNINFDEVEVNFSNFKIENSLIASNIKELEKYTTKYNIDTSKITKKSHYVKIIKKYIIENDQLKNLVSEICVWADFGIRDSLINFSGRVKREGWDYFFNNYTSAFDNWIYVEKQVAFDLSIFAKNHFRKEIIERYIKNGYSKSEITRMYDMY